MDKLAIVIPFYNEADCIPSLIKELDGFIDLIDAQTCIYAINDGSKDNSAELLESAALTRNWLKIINQANGGHGSAVLNGYYQALEDKTDWIFQMDSDQQIPIADLLPLWEQRNKSQPVLGIRRNRQDPKERLLVSRILKKIIRLLFHVKVEDANCPFRLIPANNLNHCLKFIPRKTFAPNIFISIILSKTSDIKQAFVTHCERQRGVNSINRMNLLKICKRCFGELYHFWLTRNSWKQSQNIHQSSL